LPEISDLFAGHGVSAAPAFIAKEDGFSGDLQGRPKATEATRTSE
jgi:hypothetical protein